jgi:hypothetical protein
LKEKEIEMKLLLSQWKLIVKALIYYGNHHALEDTNCLLIVSEIEENVPQVTRTQLPDPPSEIKLDI